MNYSILPCIFILSVVSYLKTDYFISYDGNPFMERLIAFLRALLKCCILHRSGVFNVLLIYLLFISQRNLHLLCFAHINAGLAEGT